MIFRICNLPVDTVTDGGSSRDLALIELTHAVGGTVEVIQDEFFFRTKLHRLLRVARLLLQVFRSPHRIVLLYYPGYPFFWKHKVTAWFFISLAFTVLLFLITRLRGKHTIIDVVDLPLYQYHDLDLPMEMSERTFHFFDSVVFSLADEIWFASNAFAKFACREYGLPDTKARTVLNGAFRVEPGSFSVEKRAEALGPLRFIYAGTMNAARELDVMLSAFTALPCSDVELHLCGIEGEWIGERYPDPRIRFHGHLSQANTLSLIRQCDVGIVPYPERGYYNWVFPSKLPLYIVGGVMVLASNAEEVARRIDEWQIGIHGPLEHIQALMRHCIDAPDVVKRYKESVHARQNEFWWDTIYSRVFKQHQLAMLGELMLA